VQNRTEKAGVNAVFVEIFINADEILITVPELVELKTPLSIIGVAQGRPLVAAVPQVVGKISAAVFATPLTVAPEGCMFQDLCAERVRKVRHGETGEGRVWKCNLLVARGSRCAKRLDAEEEKELAVRNDRTADRT